MHELSRHASLLTLLSQPFVGDDRWHEKGVCREHVCDRLFVREVAVLNGAYASFDCTSDRLARVRVRRDAESSHGSFVNDRAQFVLRILQICDAIRWT